MEDGVFTMTGGTIRNCKANNGGAVYIKKSANAIGDPKFVMTGGLIENCKASHNGGGIYLEGGSVEMTNGTIHDDLAC